MWWILGGAVAWIVLSFALGVLVGRSIRHADEREGRRDPASHR